MDLIADQKQSPAAGHDVAAEANPLSNSDATFPQFNEFPLEVRRMVWKESLPPVEPEVLIYRRDRVELWDKELQQWEEPGIGPTVEVDFPVILHVCQESRAIALEHVVFRKERTSATWSRISGDVSGWGSSDGGPDGFPGDDNSSFSLERDDQSGGGVDSPGGSTHDENGHIEHNTGDGTAASDPGNRNAALRHTDDVSDSDDGDEELDKLPDDDPDDASIPGSWFYIVCRRFIPELDYIFVNADNLTSFMDVVMKETPWLPQHLVIPYDGLVTTWNSPKIARFETLLGDCVRLRSLSVSPNHTAPSNGGHGLNLHRYRVFPWPEHLCQGPLAAPIRQGPQAALPVLYTCMFPRRISNDMPEWEIVSMQRIRALR